ncbi:MAG TPA: S53 family peptidase [Jatrophihabitans sp.]|jgi:pseudomonalisin
MLKRAALSMLAAGASGMALLIPVAASAASSPATAAASNSTGFTVTQNVLAGLKNATDLGPAAASTPLTLTVSLARPNVAAEKALISAEHNPASAEYRHFLTPAQFAARFGVPAAQRSAVISYFGSGGATVSRASTAGDVYTVRSDVGHLATLLSTSFRNYSTSGTSFLANTKAPVTPAALGITNISGLNTLQHYSLPAKLHHAPAQGTCLPALPCVGGTTPQDLWSVYQQPAAHTGAGQKIAIFGEGATDGVISDLRAFETHFGLPQIPVSVVRPAGDSGFTDDSGRPEWNIDTQASSGMAPNADSMSLYFGQDLSDADVARVFSTFTDDASSPMQASASYGECETVPVVSPVVGQVFATSGLASLPVQFGLGNNSDAALDQITRQAAAEGKTIFVSTGDTGSSCPIVAAPVIGAGNGVVNQVVPITNSPASLPYVTAVGGTVLYTNGSGARSREYGWAFSGGGSTLFTPQPDYQVGTANNNVPCVTAPSVTCRGIADVSAQSGDVVGNGYDIVSGGTFTEGGGGGTSLSSPLWEGMWVRIQSASSNAAGNGFANYPLYRVGNNSASYPRDFFDVNSLDLSTGLPASNGLYPTLPGWDYVTGFGTPRVSGLICDIDGSC